MCQPFTICTFTKQHNRSGRIQMSRKVKVSDVRQGVTLYGVHAFPHRGKNKSFITVMPISERPKNSEYMKDSLFSKFRSEFRGLNDTVHYSSFSLCDAGIVSNQYNFHKTFHTLKAAERYAARMDAVCLSKAERVRAANLSESDRMFKSMYL